MKEKSPMIEIKNISKHYIRNEKVTTALRDISLKLYSGDFVAITGESGCGKSTLMNIISGALGYDSGEIFYCQKDYSSFSSKEWNQYQTETIGYIAQDNKLVMQYTVEQNILSALMVSGWPKSVYKKKLSEVLEIVGLSDFRKHRIVQLSAGQRQRVAIARMLAKDSKIILADEATANLDPETAANILEVFRNISKDRLVILITHSYDQCKAYASRHVELKNGVVSIDEVLNKAEGDGLNKAEKENQSEKANSEDKKSGKAKSEKSQEESRSKKNSRLPLGTFIRWNLGARKAASFSIFLFFLCSFFTVFALGDLYFANADSVTIKTFDKTVFKNTSDKRILVQRTDGETITDEDLASIEAIAHVTETEKYDQINDILYFFQLDEDYQLTFKGVNNSYDILKEQFMRSESCLTESDLLSGRMPENKDEVIVSKKAADLLGEQLYMFFRLPDNGDNEQCYQHLTVVGVCDRPGNQVYFSDEICDMFDSIMRPDHATLHFVYDESHDTFKEKSMMVPTINRSLTGNEVVVENPFVYMQPRGIPRGKGLIESSRYSVFGLEDPEVSRYDVTITYRDCFESEEIMNNYWFSYTLYGGSPIDQTSYPFVEVSEELFYQMNDHGSKQMTAFIEDYIYTDEVMNAIEADGLYRCVSSYRTSMIQIDQAKQKNRNRLYLMIFATMVFLELVSFFLLMFMAGRWKADLAVLGHLGMSLKHRKCIIRRQLLILAAIAFAGASGGFFGVCLKDPKELHESLKYFGALPYAICSLIILVMMLPVFVTAIGFATKDPAVKKAKTRKEARS